MNLSSFWQQLLPTQIDMAGLKMSELASVLIAVTDSKTDPNIILTQRAFKMKTHGGQVAFPGGHWEPGDSSLAHTALRESYEEISLVRDCAAVHGRLTEQRSLHGLTVYPFVAEVPEELNLVKNPDEIESIFRVPLAFLMDTTPERIDKVERHGIRYQMPCWYFEGYEIWGLTAIFLQELLDKLDAFNTNQKPA